ncbi:hypothetical protein SeLEV6574_g08039 [Synchytrium endobioticum]|uniref:Uncharacterized protein n=1 Tax=Synchytrium endobioticum TaxID=286115 RepID=A0A507C5Z4_9FUNG|nr:hypothetical protein SeLEV6574_g08039 [Synchytrium endobioticum]
MPVLEELSTCYLPHKRPINEVSTDIEPMELSDHIPVQVKRKKKAIGGRDSSTTITWTSATKRGSDDDVDMDYEGKRRRVDYTNSMEQKDDMHDNGLNVEGWRAARPRRKLTEGHDDISWLNNQATADALLSCFKQPKARYLIENPGETSRPQSILTLPPLLPSLEEFLPKLLHQGIRWKQEHDHGSEIEDLGARIEEISDDEADRIAASTDHYTVHEFDDHRDSGSGGGVIDDVEMDVDPDYGCTSWDRGEQVGAMPLGPPQPLSDDVLTDEMHILRI